MNGVTAGATFPHRLVLENKRSALSRVAPAAGVIDFGESGPHATHARTLVGVMAIAAAQLAFHDRMMVGQVKLPPLIQMAIEADFGRSARIDDIPTPASGIDMHAPRAVARFAADLDRVGAFGAQVGMHGRLERLGNRLMTIDARLGSDEVGAFHVRRADEHSIGAHARDQNQGGQRSNCVQAELLPVRTDPAAVLPEIGTLELQFHR